MNQETVIRLQPVFGVLHQALDVALRSANDQWQFAVEIIHLREYGATDAELQMLCNSGLIKHAMESRNDQNEKRLFRQPLEAGFCPQSCFVLSKQGLETIRGLNGAKNGSSIFSSMRLAPVWNPVCHELRFAGQLIKRFKWRAPNQERLLLAFQKQNWPDQIDDPLPVDELVDSKRRLHDTIKCLNRRHSRNLIRFHGDGTGAGVIWRMVGLEPAESRNGHVKTHRTGSGKRKPGKPHTSKKPRAADSSKNSMTLGRF